MEDYKKFVVPMPMNNFEANKQGEKWHERTN